MNTKDQRVHHFTRGGLSLKQVRTDGKPRFIHPVSQTALRHSHLNAIMKDILSLAVPIIPRSLGKLPFYSLRICQARDVMYLVVQSRTSHGYCFVETHCLIMSQAFQELKYLQHIIHSGWNMLHIHIYISFCFKLCI